MTLSETAKKTLSSHLSARQREAYDYLDKIRIDWCGKPIIDRDYANATHEDQIDRPSKAV